MRQIQKVSFSEYRSWDGINATSLPPLTRSPMHYLYEKNTPKDSDAMRLGRAFHEFILEPAEFQKNFVIEKKFNLRTKQGKLDKEIFHEENPGKQIISKDMYDQILEMAIVFSKHPNASKLINGQREVSVKFDINGVPCKARADVLLAEDFIVDIKKCPDASPEGFLRSIERWGYYTQAAFYLEAFERDEFIFIAVEDKPPYGIGIYQCPPELIEYGRRIVHESVETIAKCKAEDKFPGYPETIQLLDTPAWMLKKLENKGDKLCQRNQTH